MSSKLHMVWARAVAGGLETRIRYSTLIVYNNFPLPEINSEDKQQLGQLAEAVLVEREKHAGKSIGDIYDPEQMPKGLLAAHRALDEAVEQRYRAKAFTRDDERLEYLFALYEQMSAAKGNELFEPPAKAKKKPRKTKLHA
jgi:hypothetical protein